MALLFSATVGLRPVSVRGSAVAIAVLKIAVALVTEVVGVSLLTSLVLRSTCFLCWSASVAILDVILAVILAVTLATIATLVVCVAIGGCTGIVGARLGLVVARAPIGVSWFVVWRL